MPVATVSLLPLLIIPTQDRQPLPVGGAVLETRDCAAAENCVRLSVLGGKIAETWGLVGQIPTKWGL
jgi:hypothetical protein